jgi:hypothetical protein
MPPASTDIQAEPPQRPYEPEIAPCPHCGEPVASLCLVCPHCERTISQDAENDQSVRRMRQRGPAKVVVTFFGMVVHWFAAMYAVTAALMRELNPLLIYSSVTLFLGLVSLWLRAWGPRRNPGLIGRWTSFLR